MGGHGSLLRSLVSFYHAGGACEWPISSGCRRTRHRPFPLPLAQLDRRFHYSVEVEHWLLKLLAPPDTDLARILRHFGVDFSRVRSEVAGAVDRLGTGNPGIPALSDELLAWMYSAWQFLSESQDSTSIRTGHLLAALRCEEKFAVRLRDISPELGRIDANRLWEEWPALITNWTESEAQR
jgi:type VI secretion system protein VasG